MKKKPPHSPLPPELPVFHALHEQVVLHLRSPRPVRGVRVGEHGLYVRLLRQVGRPSQRIDLKQHLINLVIQLRDCTLLKWAEIKVYI